MAEQGNSRITVNIEGVEAIAKKFALMGGLKYLIPAMKASATHVKSKVNVYPAATEANFPMARRWYERGYGPKWYTKEGAVHGKKTSQTLNRSWTIDEADGGLTQVIGTRVTYAPYVHDDDKQTWFHKRTGWKTVKTTAKEETPTILDFLKKKLEEWINKSVK